MRRYPLAVELLGNADRFLAGLLLRGESFAAAAEGGALYTDDRQGLQFSSGQQVAAANVERIEALFGELCRTRGLTLIVTSHHMASSLRMSDQIVLLRDQRAMSGTPRSLATSGDAEITEFLGADGAVLARQVAAGAPQ